MAEAMLRTKLRNHVTLTRIAATDGENGSLDVADRLTGEPEDTLASCRDICSSKAFV